MREKPEHPIGKGSVTQVISEKELMLATGYSTRSALARNLSMNGVRFFRGRRGQIWTTRDLIQAAASGDQAEDDYQDVEF